MVFAHQRVVHLDERGGKYYIAYEESELTGLEGTKTTVKLDGKTVALIRTGTFPSHMLFAEDERHVGLYQTPIGQDMRERIVSQTSFFMLSNAPNQNLEISTSPALVSTSS